jgi:hypothetical protein
MIRKAGRRYRRPKRQKKSRQKLKSLLGQTWLIPILAWAVTIGFFFTVPPQFWWQITIGLGLVFVSLFLTIKALDQNLIFSLVLAGLICLLPLLKILRLLTWPIIFLILLSIVLLISYFLLEKNN